MSARVITRTNCTVIILAAGQSSRLGKPKQLLKYQDKTLLQHAIDTAKQSSVQSIIVVLGSNADIIMNEIDASDIQIVKNDEWPSGMASAIRSGVRQLHPNTEAVILMVCDQPFVTSGLLNSLIDKQKETVNPIIASHYGETIGTPALFHKRFFSELLALQGDTGAKKIMMENGDLLATVSFPGGSIDIDTMADYEALRK